MKRYDNGAVGITVEHDRSTVRMLDHVPVGHRSPYVGVGQITRLPNGVALLSGFCGALTGAHCWLILTALIAEGYRVAYIERLDGHSVPCSERVADGDFAGLWRVDLSAVRDRRKRTPTAAGATPCPCSPA